MFGFIKNASKNGESYRKLYRAHIGLTNILLKNKMLPLSSGEKVLVNVYYISCFQPLFTSHKWFLVNFDRVVAEDNSKNPNSIIGFDKAAMTGAMLLLNLDPQNHLLDIPQKDLLDIIESPKRDSKHLETALNVSSYALDVHVDNFIQNTTLPYLIKKYGDQMGMK